MKVCLCVLQCPTRPGTCNCHVITARTGRWRCPGALLTKDTASSESILWVLFICIKLNHSKDDHSSDTDITSCMLILPRELVQLFHIFHSVLSLLHSYTSSLVVNCLSHSSVSALTQSVCVFCVFVSVCCASGWVQWRRSWLDVTEMHQNQHWGEGAAAWHSVQVQGKTCTHMHIHINTCARAHTHTHTHTHTHHVSLHNIMMFSCTVQHVELLLWCCFSGGSSDQSRCGQLDRGKIHHPQERWVTHTQSFENLSNTATCWWLTGTQVVQVCSTWR